MKLILIFLAILPISGFAQQPSVITHAIINATMTVIAPEEEDASRVPSAGDQGMRFSRMSNFTSLNGLNQLQGLAIKYEMKIRRKRTLQMEVTKVDLKKELTEKDFRIPKDFDVKPYSEFSQMFRGTPGMRMIPR